ncbi:glutathione peroxidase [Jatrophihabitans endophyticus]|uniref:Glutathione peroxidase n=1 Tax=Jatrophihabitans endophyticus TaxID=1206085 RepID=A0A1M5DCD7_9ACTN|nr:glutathione peroxidase [Jatrophihabitans endophyticus]SHF64585.1 glutathione peroxidase [Jatrophihabitans endophyticus]
MLDVPVQTLAGEDTSLREYAAGGPLLVVNVASKCGLTPQYEGLQELHERYGERGLRVLGFPCNQFMGQEPGTPQEIQQFCSTNYSVSFPLFAKIDVNGADRHPLYAQLAATADADGEAGDVQWNFEKFLLDADGVVLERFRPRTEPLDPTVVTAIETALGDTAPSA